MSRAPQAVRTWAWAFLAWTLLGLTYAAAMVGSGRLKQQEVPWPVALGFNLASCYLWMALSPLVIRAARWAGFEARQWARALAVHLPCYAVVALVHHVIFLNLYWRWGSPIFTSGTPLATVLRTSLPWRLHDGLVVYGLLLLSLYALHHVRKGEAEREARLEMEALLATAQLRALRMQLQPHFLFNTLNAISALVGEDPARAKTMIARLGLFLRLTLEDQAGGEVPLRQELRLLEAYLDIQRLRFENRIAFEVTVPNEALDLRVPNLVLQPLVENALQHGLTRRPGSGSLTVRAYQRAASLCLEVEDDGVGLPEPLQEGVGLTNTRARLRTRHGDAARLSLHALAAGGVLARVELPWEPF